MSVPATASEIKALVAQAKAELFHRITAGNPNAVNVMTPRVPPRTPFGGGEAA